MLKAAVEIPGFTDTMTGVADSGKCGVIRKLLVWCECGSGGGGGSAYKATCVHTLSNAWFTHMAAG